eukprot:657693-Hanusia_phi.AAC.4
MAQGGRSQVQGFHSSLDIPRKHEWRQGGLKARARSRQVAGEGKAQEQSIVAQCRAVIGLQGKSFDVHLLRLLKGHWAILPKSRVGFPCHILQDVCATYSRSCTARKHEKDTRQSLSRTSPLCCFR